MLLADIQAALDENDIPSGIIYGQNGPVLRVVQDLPNGWEFRMHITHDKEGLQFYAHPWDGKKNPTDRTVCGKTPVGGIIDQATVDAMVFAIRACLATAPDTFGRMPTNWTAGEMN